MKKNKNKRFFHEMANIQFHDNTINRAQDTNNLKIVYKNSINLIKKMRNKKGKKNYRKNFFTKK